jgi:hypothetical protein
MLVRNSSTGAFEVYYVSGNNIANAALVGRSDWTGILPASATLTARAA